MSYKVTIVAEPEALFKLSMNKGFTEGRNLRKIFSNLSEIFLIMDEREFEAQWMDSESPIRKVVDAYNLPRPKAKSGLKKIYTNPGLCYEKAPFAIWLLNNTEENLRKFKDYLGVWAVDTSELTDDFFYLNHSRGYDKDDEITGSRGNGWGNFLEQIPNPLPPINSIVLNDRHLIFNTNESRAARTGFWGFNNLKILLNEILPRSLKVPFHIFIYCQHPRLDITTTDSIVSRFIQDVKNLREYEIIVELVYAVARHKRGLYSNYFLLDADRGFNVFKDANCTVLCGENDLTIKSYLCDPYSSGDTSYDSARSKIQKICNACREVYLNPTTDTENPEKNARVQTDCDDFFYNRLFS